MGDVVCLVRLNGIDQAQSFLERVRSSYPTISWPVPIWRPGELIGVRISAASVKEFMHQYEAFTDPNHHCRSLRWRVKHFLAKLGGGGQSRVRYRARPKRRALRPVS